MTFRDPDTKIHRFWLNFHLFGRITFWATLGFLLLVVAVALDSMARDFVLFFGLIALGILCALRELAHREILYGRVMEHANPVIPEVNHE